MADDPEPDLTVAAAYECSICGGRLIATDERGSRCPSCGAPYTAFVPCDALPIEPLPLPPGNANFAEFMDDLRRKIVQAFWY